MSLQVRTADGRIERITISLEELRKAVAQSQERAASRLVPADDLFLLVESARIRLAYAFDPYFAVSLSGVEPLPHQLEAVYQRMLPQPRLRFALCDDPGAGKTIMAGLLVKELKLRGALDRVLVLAPAPLTIQWQDEMRSKFDEVFEIVGSDLARNQLAGNAWERFPQCISSIDFSKQDSVAPGLLRARWDLVIVDEAHKASARTNGEKIDRTRRYSLVEQLSANTERLLLLTATPHSGNVDQFAHFMRLLDPDQFADPRMSDHPRVEAHFLAEGSPFFLRRMKEDLRDFNGRKLFRDRHAFTEQFYLGTREKALYDAVTRYINDYLPRAQGRRRSSVALARTVFQRRLASSLRAIRKSLENRQHRLKDTLAELDRMTSAQQERWLRANQDTPLDVEQDSADEDEDTQEEYAASAVSAHRVADIQREVAALEGLIRLAIATEESGEEAKLNALRSCLRKAQFAELSEGAGKLLIFTEHRDTLDYLREHLEREGYRCCVIHGGMDALQRKDAQWVFEHEAQICIATEAAGEGINLQFCHLMINYDVPWSPVRLEQRMGRIHRLGQEKDVYIFNFAAENTVEGEIVQRLLRKLNEMKAALGGRVFDVIGLLLQLNNLDLEEMLREAAYNPQQAREFEEQIDRISPEKLKDLEQATGIALAVSQVDLSPIREQDRRSEERRLMPEYVETFFRAAADQTGLRVEERADTLLRVEHVNEKFRSHNLEAVRRYGMPRDAYRKLTFRQKDLRREQNRDAELLSPGHPLFAAVSEVLGQRLGTAARGAAAFIDPGGPAPYRLHFFEVRVLGERPGTAPGQSAQPTVLHAALVAVAEDAAGRREVAAADILHDLTPIEPNSGSALSALPGAPTPAQLEDLEDWVAANVQYGLEQEQRRAREREIGLRDKYLREAFAASTKAAQGKYMKLQARVLAGDTDAKLARDTARRKVDELAERQQQKLGELAHLRVVRSGPITYLGSALVVPAPADPDVADRLRRDDDLDPTWLTRDDEVERIAMEHVMDHERKRGWEPHDVSKLRDGSGFDIRSLGPGDTEGRRPVRRIEVKGRAPVQGDVILTPNEWLQARRHRETYWLYVVSGCGSGHEQLHAIQDPATKLKHAAQELTVVKGYRILGAAIAAAAQ
jgi:superfamily II DNA or RNA helicase